MKVRVVKMNGVDIGLFQFDFDLTWACFFMNKHGHIYARYGARKSEKAEELLSPKGLAAVMKKVLEAHKADADKKPPKWTPKYPEQNPNLPADLKSGKRCIHCHQAWSPGSAKDLLKQYPLPQQIGLTMDKDNPAMVMSVEPGSVAEKAGLKAKDELVTLNGQPVYSDADIAQVLQNLPKSATGLKVEIRKSGTTETELVGLTLQAGGEWRERDISWRGSMWPLRPGPGFGGPKLNEDEIGHAGLKAGSWAIRVNYVIDWGNDPYGKAAQKAGIARGDIVTAVAGKSDFESELAMQAWFRLNVKPGSVVEFDILRGGKPQKVRMQVP